MKQLAMLVFVKAVVMAAVVVSVVRDRGLSMFDQALIIAMVSAAMTGTFTLCAAFIAVRAVRPAREEVRETHQLMVDATNGDEQHG